MIRCLLSEERGMALGLAIIVVVIVGVMGAGLMTIVATDLEAIVAVNRGEQAFELAEAGIEVAKAHLANDPSLSAPGVRRRRRRTCPRSPARASPPAGRPT